MTKKEWKRKIYRGMEAELRYQVFDLGAEWLTLDLEGDVLPKTELKRMEEVACEIMDRFAKLAGSKFDKNGKVKFPDIG